MGYQALLFCPDEKLTRVVAQVFSDLEFNVEAVQEPFSAVKKLMAQRYDALVVDCENDSNASLLFKSARNSTPNQGTLAIAVVEGQAGVAKAYRIGANLVLTKPINIEQAKGTLRVARGLLRKNAEVTAAPAAPDPAVQQAPAVSPASASSMSAPIAPIAPAAPATADLVLPTGTPVPPVRPTVAPPAPPKVKREVPEFEPVAPAMASASEVPVAAASLPEAPVKPVAPAEIPASAAVAPPELVKAAPPKVPATVIGPAGQAAAAAPAKVKEITPAAPAKVELEPDPVVEGADSEPLGSTPSFSALDLDRSSTSGVGKKLVIAAAVVIAFAALVYFGWSRMGTHKPATPATGTIVTPQAPLRPAPVPDPVPAPSVPATASASVAEHSAPTVSEPVNSKPSPSVEPQKLTAPAGTRPQTASEPEVKVTNFVAPIKVKAGADSRAKSNDEPNAVPTPLAIADANTDTLNNLVSSAPAASRPTLATLKISQGVSQGLLIKRVDPKYPPSALAMHVQGAVLLDATINKEGSISNVTVVKGDKILSHAATEAVRQWRYKPYYLDGSPVEIQTQITINFKLPN